MNKICLIIIGLLLADCNTEVKVNDLKISDSTKVVDSPINEPEDLDEEREVKDSIFKETYLKKMYDADVISLENDSIYFVIPFDIHGYDCGAPDCYETVVSFGFNNSQPLSFPSQLNFNEYTLGCVEERKHFKGIFLLEEENKELIIYNSINNEKSILLLKQKGNFDSYVYYFDNFNSKITTRNFSELLKYDENTEENRIPYISYILSIRAESNYIN